ncbi:methyltransferase [Chryseolinea lacunae]|uniref:Methyltransferase domain-containing protein n=1 Tax=Chryseolinea lacunae TaxID=2801331 RepID=A0ABS1KP79_9BACT|nr:methyltransferase [Chryseolinea lacunae]MBL0741280.1 methyltransferase domain-containing protein [Chryseolinea lacunae]
MDFYDKERLTALQAKEEAQWITFAPFVFQATRVLRNSGILTTVEAHRQGITLQELTEKIDLPAYGVRVLVEAGLGIGLLVLSEGKYKITKTTYFILHDELTKVNMDFTHDVCYNGMYFLEESIKNQKPEGLKVFGQWPTIYEALSTNLPDKAKKSWFAFDHFYSDYAYPEVLPHVYAFKPKRMLEIGGNTGKWSMASFAFDPDVNITIMDLPGYVEGAKGKLEELGYGHRISFHPGNVLDETQKFPQGFDAVWMSQFLDCFSDDEIVSILTRAKQALNPDGHIFILETFWDRQRFEASAFSLQQTSLYFTVMANGNSQMYDSKVFLECVKRAGLDVVEDKDYIGVSHTLLVCKPVK